MGSEVLPVAQRQTGDFSTARALCPYYLSARCQFFVRKGFNMRGGEVGTVSHARRWATHNENNRIMRSVRRENLAAAAAAVVLAVGKVRSC